MNTFATDYLAFYKRALQVRRSMPAQDVAVLCVLASEPNRTFTTQQIADAMETIYITAWNSLRRLQLAGLALGGRLSETGLYAMGIDQDGSAATSGDLY